MVDKHSLNYDVRELKLGASFTNNKASQYHTIKYDFKPASVDVNKMATVSVGTKNEVTVTVPHLAGAGVPQTVFKGNQKPYTKECVLIIDKVTGEITLEKLSSNIQVKKTRQETAQKPRPLTPVTTDFTNTTQRSTSRTRVATNRRTNPNAGPAGVAPALNQARFNGTVPGAGSVGSGVGAGVGGPKPPQNMVRSPQRIKTSPPQAAPWSGGGNSTLASLPMIGLDDALGLTPAAPAAIVGPTGSVGHANNVGHAGSGGHTGLVGHGGSVSHAGSVGHTGSMGHSGGGGHPGSLGHIGGGGGAGGAGGAGSGGSGHHNGYARAPPPLDARPHHTPHVPPANMQPQQDDSSSSSSSDSGSDSDSGSESDDATRRPIPNGNASNPALPTDVLNDDLCLSESGSDSD